MLIKGMSYEKKKTHVQELCLQRFTFVKKSSNKKQEEKERKSYFEEFSLRQIFPETTRNSLTHTGKQTKIIIISGLFM